MISYDLTEIDVLTKYFVRKKLFYLLRTTFDIQEFDMNPRKNSNQQLSKEKFEALRLYLKLSSSFRRSAITRLK